jgi:hypothetical protein
MTRGFDQRSIAAALVEKGYLAPGRNRRNAKSITVPGHDKQRLYHFVRTNEQEHEAPEEDLASPPKDEWS